jgi:hypothetical protein
MLGQLHPPLLKLPAMPEITIDEDRDHCRANDEVRSSWQVSCMRLELHSELLKNLLHRDLGLCPASAYAGHHSAPLFRRHDVAAVQPGARWT